MLKKFRILLSICLAGVLAPPVSAQAPVELKFSVQTPPQVHYNAQLFVPWAEKVAQDSNGTLSIKMFFAGTLGKEGQFIDLIRSGATDIALDLPAYYPGRFPLTEVAGLPLIIREGASGSQALWNLYEDEVFQNEFDGFKVLAITTPPAAVLFSTEKQIKMPADLAGLKIAAGGKLKGRTVSTLGAAPIDIKTPDLYQALDRGLADGAINFYTAAPPFKINEVTQHVLNVPMGGSMLVVLMSQAKFDSLPPEAQKALDDNSGLAFSQAFGQVWDRANDVGIGMVHDSGGTITEADETTLAAWSEALAPVIDDWATSVEGGREAVDALRRALSQ